MTGMYTWLLLAHAVGVGSALRLGNNKHGLLLSSPARRRMATSLQQAASNNDRDSTYTIAILGDLHLDPRYMEDHIVGREHFKKIILDKEGNPKPNTCVVSLGDLGESKSIAPEKTKELFAGTSACLQLARDYLDGFKTPFEVVGGNHDLEGLDEFETDQQNLDAYLRILGKPTPQFKRLIAEKTMLVGLGSTVFRDALYTSHEVFVDDAQVEWFEQTIKECPADEGWRVFVFSHAPPMGSGLRVLQENHVINGCCWLNHSGRNIDKFIDVVRKNPCIKAWFSGHFHLGQDYEDSITYPEGNNRGSCVFAQTAVMSKKSTRDTRQQSRLVRGTKNGFTISTIDHTKDGKERLDATVTYMGNNAESVVYAHPSEDYDHDAFFSAYVPQPDDGCYLPDDINVDVGKDGAVCWFHLSCGRVLGVHGGMVLEYDPSTLAPLGLVVAKDELAGRQLAVVDSGLDGGVGKAPGREQAVILYDDEMNVTVVQPNEDGSYWRKIVRNKVVRMKEVRRERAAMNFLMKNFNAEKEKIKVKSSWGPYTSTSGNAKNTGVPGLTAPVSAGKPEKASKGGGDD